jgi:hypothetical protein
LVASIFLSKTLGIGATVTVFLAAESANEREVALKVLEPTSLIGVPPEEARQDFLSEARAAMCLRHSNIATVY